MVKFRLARGGVKKKPFYRIVVAEGTAHRNGRFLEKIGTYNPHTQERAVEIKEDRLQHWVAQGAQASETVRSLLKKQGISLEA